MKCSLNDVTPQDVPMCAVMSFAHVTNELVLKPTTGDWRDVISRDDRIYYVVGTLAILVGLSMLPRSA